MNNSFQKRPKKRKTENVQKIKILFTLGFDFWKMKKTNFGIVTVRLAEIRESPPHSP